MRNIMRSVILASFVAAGGCATTSGTDGPTAAEVEGAAVALCSYLPTAASVAALLNANGAIMTAEAIAEVICAAVGPPPAKQSVRLKATGPVKVVINGQTVVITGAFVAGITGERVR